MAAMLVACHLNLGDASARLFILLDETGRAGDHFPQWKTASGRCQLETIFVSSASRSWNGSKPAMKGLPLS